MRAAWKAGARPAMTPARIEVLGVVLGAMLIGIVNNALVLLVVPTYWQQTFTGAVIVAAALIDQMRRR